MSKTYKWDGEVYITWAGEMYISPIEVGEAASREFQLERESRTNRQAQTEYPENVRTYPEIVTTVFGEGREREFLLGLPNYCKTNENQTERRSWWKEYAIGRILKERVELTHDDMTVINNVFSNDIGGL